MTGHPVMAVSILLWHQAGTNAGLLMTQEATKKIALCSLVNPAFLKESSSGITAKGHPLGRGSGAELGIELPDEVLS
jgi:hypothetical protein